MRDEASYTRQAYENEEQRKTTLYATALSNEGVASKDSKTSYNALKTIIDNIFKSKAGRG